MFATTARASHAISKRLARLLTALLFAVSFSGCAAHSAIVPHEIALIDGRSDYNLNPYLAFSQESYDLFPLTMAAFVRWGDKPDDFVPELLTRLPTRANGDISADFRHITLHLRHGVKWSDGVAFSAEDVVYTWRELLKSNLLADGWTQLESVRALDADTALLTTKEPQANFVLQYLVGPMRYILPEHAIGDRPLGQSAFNRQPLGANMFVYKSVSPGQEFVLVANPLYWRGRPKLDKIIVRVRPDPDSDFAAMKTGEADILANVEASRFEQAKSTTSAKLFELRTYGTLRMYLNLASPLTKDIAVRKALRLGLDRPFIARNVFHGSGALYESLLIPDDRFTVAQPMDPYDPEAAARLLDGAGWRRGPDGVRQKDGQRLSLRLFAPAADFAIDQSVEIARASWRKIGIDLQVLRLPISVLTASDGAVAKGDFEVAVVPYGSASIWLGRQFLCSSAPPNGLNLTRFCDHRFDRLVDELQAAGDDTKRRAIYAEMQQRVESQLLFINIIQLPNFLLVGPRVTGLHANPWSIFERFATVDAR